MAWRNTLTILASIFVTLGVLSIAFEGKAHAQLGACCYSNGTCLEQTVEMCFYFDGQWMGLGTSCSDPLACPLWGACCLADGTCIDGVSPHGCEGDPYGFHLGETCDTVTCFIGACCCTGYCMNLTDWECLRDCFTWTEGLGTSCDDPLICGDMGACCLADGSCWDNAFAESCWSDEGPGTMYYGSRCKDVQCRPPWGAASVVETAQPTSDAVNNLMLCFLPIGAIGVLLLARGLRKKK
jgi:hypothetical protein